MSYILYMKDTRWVKKNQSLGSLGRDYSSFEVSHRSWRIEATSLDAQNTAMKAISRYFPIQPEVYTLILWHFFSPLIAINIPIFHFFMCIYNIYHMYVYIYISRTLKYPLFWLEKALFCWRVDGLTFTRGWPPSLQGATSHAWRGSVLCNEAAPVQVDDGTGVGTGWSWLFI